MSDLEIPGAGGSANVSDAAYDATAWDGDTDAPTKNAIRDKIETLTGGHDPVTVTDSAEIDFTLTDQELTASLNAASIDESKLDASVNASLDLADSATQPGDLATVATSGDYDDLSNKPDLSAFDNISEHANEAAFPGTGAADKFYLAQDTGILYRWTGSAYAIISAQLALGETSSTAYRGDRGKTAFDHVSATDNPHSVSKAQVGLSNVPNTNATARASHTGTQLAATISDFAATVRATVLTGLSTATSTAVVAADTILVAIGKLQAQVNLKAGIRGSVNAQTGTTYTLVIGDEYLNGVSMTNASANTLTIPPNADVALPVGTKVFITQGGAGSTTIAAGAGVTINAPSTVTLAIDEQHESRVCQKISTDTWLLI